jgi:hypothetical protein
MKYPLLILTIILSACSHSSSPNYEEMADKITYATAKKLRSEKNLRLIGTGGGMMHSIRMMAMSFVFKHEITIEEGRELLVAAVSEYVAAVNANEKIRPFLANYPFEPKNVEIQIFIHNPDNSCMPHGKICVIGAIDGILDYDIRDSETDLLKEIYRETYEEALQAMRLKNEQKE